MPGKSFKNHGMRKLWLSPSQNLFITVAFIQQSIIKFPCGNSHVLLLNMLMKESDEALLPSDGTWKRRPHYKHHSPRN